MTDQRSVVGLFLFSKLRSRPMIIPLHGTHYIEIQKEVPIGVYDCYANDFDYILDSIVFTSTIE